MECSAKIRSQFLHLSLSHHQIHSISKLISSLSFKTPFSPPSKPFKPLSIRASASPPPPPPPPPPSSGEDPLPQNPSSSTPPSPSGKDPLPQNPSASSSGEDPNLPSSSPSPSLSLSSGEDPLQKNPSASSSPSPPSTGEDEMEALLRQGYKPAPKWVNFLLGIDLGLLDLSVAAVLGLLAFFSPYNKLRGVDLPPVEKRPKGLVHMFDEEVGEDTLDLSTTDVQALRSFLRTAVENDGDEVSIKILERLIELEPDKNEWQFFKARIHKGQGQLELAKKGYEELIEKDPLCVDAYQGILSLIEDDSDGEMDDLLKRVERAMEISKEENKVEDLRDLKQLTGKIEFLKCNFADALRIYQELKEEDPADHVPFYAQGLIYASLNMKKEAEEQFKKFELLAPEEAIRDFDEKKIIRELSRFARRNRRKRAAKGKNRRKRAAKGKNEGVLAAEADNEGELAAEADNEEELAAKAEIGGELAEKTENEGKIIEAKNENE